VVIELPKGGCVPCFRQHEAARVVQNAGPKRLWLASAMAGLTLAGAATGGWWAVHKNLPIPIAVLPLLNLTQDPASDYLADGLTSEIISELSIIEGWKFARRLHVLRLRGNRATYRRRPASLQQITSSRAPFCVSDNSCGSTRDWFGHATMFRSGPTNLSVSLPM
jgi:hypothetical protein